MPFPFTPAGMTIFCPIDFGASRITYKEAIKIRKSKNCSFLLQLSRCGGICPVHRYHFSHQLRLWLLLTLTGFPHQRRCFHHFHDFCRRWLYWEDPISPIMDISPISLSRQLCTFRQQAFPFLNLAKLKTWRDSWLGEIEKHGEM